MKKILPLAEPPITTFPSYAAALGIMANYKESYDWFYSQYIQLCAIEITNPYEKEHTHAPYVPIFFVDTDVRRLTNTFSDYYFVMRENCPYLNIFEIPNELIDSFSGSFVEFIKYCIRTGMYIFTFLDVSKIKQYRQVPSKFHEIFIFGYDDENEIVHFADFPINNASKYSYSTCPYNEIEEAYSSMKQFEYPLIKSTALIKYSDSIPYTFDMKYVKDSICSYIEPNHIRAEEYNEYVMSLFSALGWNTKTYLGVDIYDFLLNYIGSEVKRNRQHISVELFHGFLDHKEMMIKRIKYFMCKGYFDEDKEDFVAEYRKVRDNIKIVRNLIIKYNISQNQIELKKAIDILQETREIEIPLLRKLL